MKLIPFAIIAAVAGIAAANPILAGSYETTEHSIETGNVPFTVIVDLSGFQFWDEQGSAINERLSVSVGHGACITNIAWDINLTTYADPNASFPSWASEATMLFEGMETVNVSNDDFGVVNQAYMGNQSVDIELANTDSMLGIELFESFDDSIGFVDAMFEANSRITIRGLNHFPTPSSLSMLGLAGLIATRRKR